MASKSAGQRRRKNAGVTQVSVTAVTQEHAEEGFTPRQGQRTFRQELPNMVLLVLLYMMQGVPMGLSSGSIPFLLQANASYTQLGIFSLASYPYSFKLFWSPIVDSLYSSTLGRRKTWIVPIQLASAGVMLVGAGWAESALQTANLPAITALFFVLVLLAATQDIAVDGWALTLLSRRYVGYASACQTVGMNIGYFMSFTGFLAFNDPDFSARLFGQRFAVQGLLQLGPYLRFWAWIYIAITLFIAIFKPEEPIRPAGSPTNGHPVAAYEEEEEEEEQEVGLKEAYQQLWRVICLPAVQQLALVLFTYRLFMLPAESVAAFKLLEKGVAKDALAGLVLLQFPCELASAVVAGRWAASSSAAKPLLLGFRLRLLMAVLTTTLVLYFPAGATGIAKHPWEFLLLGASGLVSSFASTLMFTALGSLFNRISDPSMGGSYLTLLNTIANMGYTMPKVVIFWMMDALTTRECQSPEGGPGDHLAGLRCPAARSAALASNPCTDVGGVCGLTRDGFYLLSYVAAAIGVLCIRIYARVIPRLESLPLDAWRSKVRTA